MSHEEGHPSYQERLNRARARGSAATEPQAAEPTPRHPSYQERLDRERDPSHLSWHGRTTPSTPRGLPQEAERTSTQLGWDISPTSPGFNLLGFDNPLDDLANSVANNLRQVAIVESGRFENLLRGIGLVDKPFLSGAEFENFKQSVQTPSEGVIDDIAEIIAGPMTGFMSGPSITQEEAAHDPLVGLGLAVPGGAGAITNATRILQRMPRAIKPDWRTVKPVLTAQDAIMGGPLPEGGLSAQDKLAPLLRQSARNLRLQKNTDRVKMGEKLRRGIDAAKKAPPSKKAAAFFSQHGGELPRLPLNLERSSFFRDLISDPDSLDLGILDTAIYKHINAKTNPYFGPDTSTALHKVLAGETPQRAQLQALNEVFGDAVTSRLMDTGMKRFGNTVLDIANIPRAIVTSFDMSAPLRQGLVLLPGHPKRFSESGLDMVKSFFHEGSARRFENVLENHENFEYLTQRGLAYTRRGRGVGLTGREESFATSFVQKLGQSDSEFLKLISLPLRASERAYTTFLNKLRFDVANDQLVKWKNLDLPEQEISDRTEQWVRFVNRATGRGGLGPLEKAAAPLNVAFFSPRLLASRMTLPLSLFEQSPEIRKLVAKDLTLFAGAVGTTLTVLNMHDGVDIEPNPESSDFGRIRIGPTRVDIMGGFQPIVRYATQFITNERKSTATGNFSDLNRAETVGRFLRSKLSPQSAIVADSLIGTGFLGEEVDVRNPKTYIERLTPFFINDMKEAIQENGLLGGAVASSAFFGTGVLSYQTPNDASEAMFGVSFADLPYPFMQDIARELYNQSSTQEPTGIFAELDALDEKQQLTLNILAQGRAPMTDEQGNTVAGRRLPKSKIVGAYFNTNSAFANLRSGMFRAAFGQREEDAWGWNMSSLISSFKGSGTSLNEQALDQYYAAQKKASPVPGFFDSRLWDQSLAQLEKGWTPDQLQYVIANTHRRDIPERLLRALPIRTRRRYQNSQNARTKLLKEFRREHPVGDDERADDRNKQSRERMQRLIKETRSQP